MSVSLSLQDATSNERIGVSARWAEPRDGVGSGPYTHYRADYNDGQNAIYSGGGKESFRLVPIIPMK